VRVYITLHNGRVVCAQVDEFSTVVHRVSGDLQEIKWVGSEGATERLHYVRISQIDSVTLVSEPGDPKTKKEEG
jgi:hypothetical protein